MTKWEARRSARGRGHSTGVSRSLCRGEETGREEGGQQCPLSARGQPRHHVQPCGPPSHLTGGFRARPGGDAKPGPRGPQEAPSDIAAPGQESALPSVLCMLRSFRLALETQAAPVSVSTPYPQWSCSHHSPRAGHLAHPLAAPVAPLRFLAHRCVLFQGLL